VEGIGEGVADLRFVDGLDVAGDESELRGVDLAARRIDRKKRHEL
jgi:hypothetical protein